jgi:hypothetical protein
MGVRKRQYALVLLPNLATKMRLAQSPAVARTERVFVRARQVVSVLTRADSRIRLDEIGRQISRMRQRAPFAGLGRPMRPAAHRDGAGKVVYAFHAVAFQCTITMKDVGPRVHCA